MIFLLGKELFYKATTIVLLLLFFMQVEAQQRAPDSIAGATIVNAEEFIELFDKHADIVVIDARLTADRKQGYIEGSINLPDNLTNCEKLSSLVRVRPKLVVFYCNSENCMRSAKAVKKAISCGYKNVYWFRGGFEEWLLKGYPYLKN